MTRRIRIASFFLAAFWLSLSGQHVLAQPAVEAEQEARSALQQAQSEKNWPRALHYIDALLKRRPRDIALLGQKGDILTAMGKSEEAMHIFRQRTELAPKDAGAWNDLCWQVIFARGPLKARAACQRSVALRKAYDNTANLGHTYLLTNDSPGAYRWYRETIKLMEHDGALFANKGPVVAFDQFIKNGWLTNESRKARAWMLKHFNESREAEDLKKRALALAQQIDAQPDNQDTQTRQRDNAEVIALLEKALTIVEKRRGANHPQTQSILEALAERHAIMGHDAKAEALLQRLLTRTKKQYGNNHPHTADVLTRLVLLFKRAHQYKKALPLTEQLIAIAEKTYGVGHPKAIEQMEQIAGYHQAAGFVENELALRRRILTLTEKTAAPSPERLMRIAILYAYTDDDDNAALFFARARTARGQSSANKPALAPATPTRAPSPTAAATEKETRDALYKAWREKDWSQALQHVDALTQMHPTDGTLLRWKGYFLAQLERNDAALAAYRLSTERSPDNNDGWNGLCWQLILARQLPEARAACMRSVSIKKHFANTVNLGHTYLLAGDAASAYQHYRDTLPLITSEKALINGPLSDFDIFIKRGWETRESKKARDWMTQEYAQQQKKNDRHEKLVGLLKTRPDIHLLPLKPQTEADKKFAALYQSGQYAEARKLADALLSPTDPKKKTSPSDTVIWLNNLALVHHALGDTAKAVTLLRRALTLSTKVNDPVHAHTRIVVANLGALHENQSAFGRATALYQRLLEKNDVPKTPGVDAILLASRISTMTSVANTPEGRLWHDMCAYAISRDTPSLRTARILDNLALHQYLNGDWEKTLAHLRRAQDIREKRFGEAHPETIAGLRAIAWLHAVRGQTAEADASFERLVANGEKMFAYTPTVSPSILAGYRDYARLLGEWQRPDKALHLFELSKARARLGSLAPHATRLSLPETEATALTSLRRQLTELNEKIARQGDAPIAPALLTQRDQLQRDVLAMHQHLAKTHPKYARLTTPEVTDAQQTAKLLPTRAVFVSYLANDGRVLTITMDDSGKPRYHDLGLLDDLTRSIDDYRSALVQQDTGNKLRALQDRLSRSLLAPLESVLSEKQQWIISPDAALARLPFDTLTLNQTPVLKSHDLGFTPTLSDYASTAQRARQYAMASRPKTLFGLAYPDAASEALVENVSKLFDNAQTDLYLGNQAVEVPLQNLNARGKLRQYRYLMLAAPHAEYDKGKLSTPEWLAYYLESDLVSLLASDKSGQPALADENLTQWPFVLGLAGNTNTLLTLWRPDDSARGEYLRRFFARLKSGDTPVKALNAVKREFLNDPTYRHPAHWAAFVLYGQ